MKKYQPSVLEKKWRKIWQKEGLYKFKYDEKKKKFYVLVELPYTSGDLHIGHWFAFVTPDVVARFKRMNGFNVFFPIGYDAFGLPAENAAIRHKIHPQDWTLKNIATMTKQFSYMGSMINNWEDVVVTCLPEYYRFNQWIFLKMWKKGLIYRGEALSNWCPSCQTVLANENVVNGACWRCDSRVEQKRVPQWFIKITEYAEKLIWPAKPKVDWPLSVRVGQNNWIGKSEGIKVNFKLENGVNFWVFTTRLDTIFGATFLVISPERVDLEKHVVFEKRKEVTDYIKKISFKSELERKENKQKTGIFTGVYGVNPVNGEKIPLYVADYVLSSYGTGAIMAVPAHDERDFEFAQKFNLPIKKVIVKDKNKKKTDVEKPMVEEGILINSGEFTGLSSSQGQEKIYEMLRKKGLARRQIVFHLRDWSISRQRYWGTPVPMIHCPKCGIVPVRYQDLPVKLPYKVDFTPKGKPPLATNEKWLATICPKCGGKARRDDETLDTFFDSSWYWLRYVSPHYEKGPFDKDLVKKVTPVDIYFGGAEHTLGHTLYARFFTKFFYDLSILDYEEFALKRVQHGIVLGPDGEKMSKSKGNVINPDEQVKEYGADAVRLYLCFIMPYQSTGPWSAEAMAGVYRFLKRLFQVFLSYKDKNLPAKEEKELVVKLNKTIKKVTADIERIKLNTAVAAMMEFLNEWEKAMEGSAKIFSRDQLASRLSSGPRAHHSSCQSQGSLLRSLAQTTDSQKNFASLSIKERKIDDFGSLPLSQENAKKFLQILAPFAPFLTEEIWREVFGERQSIHLSSWPKAEVVEDEEITIPVQVNGKLRETIKIQSSKIKDKKYIEEQSLKSEKVKKYLGEGKYKMIYVEGKVVNLAVI